jgi:predicted enzyme related to lactoylglutathione lyase
MAKALKDPPLKPVKTMKNLISIIEIPVLDFSGAVDYYQTVLGVAIEEVHKEGTQMGV